MKRRNNIAGIGATPLGTRIPNPASRVPGSVIVRNSHIHGRGVFARRDIPNGARIIEYKGEKITKAEAERRCDKELNSHKADPSSGAVYVFELNKRYDIDGNVSYNTARHINHSCDPNADTEIIRGKIWIMAMRDIAKGEEITYNYGYAYDNEDEHPCRCGTSRCLGYILDEDHWPLFWRDWVHGTFVGVNREG